jgi:hypothetical protein
MNNRLWVLSIVLGVVVVGLGLSIVGIIFPVYELISQTLAYELITIAFVFLLIGINLISEGIYRLRKPKGERNPWWKDFRLIRYAGTLGLWLVWWGASTLAHMPIPLLAFILFPAGFIAGFPFLIYRIIKEGKD